LSDPLASKVRVRVPELALVNSAGPSNVIVPRGGVEPALTVIGMSSGSAVVVLSAVPLAFSIVAPD
jgi:hypothetical protein